MVECVCVCLSVCLSVCVPVCVCAKARASPSAEQQRQKQWRRRRLRQRRRLQLRPSQQRQRHSNRIRRAQSDNSKSHSQWHGGAAVKCLSLEKSSPGADCSSQQSLLITNQSSSSSSSCRPLAALPSCRLILIIRRYLCLDYSSVFMLCWRLVVVVALATRQCAVWSASEPTPMILMLSVAWCARWYVCYAL